VNAEEFDRSWVENPATGCWEWTRGRFAGGYGQVHWRGKGGQLAHRVAYELQIGPIPPGLVVRHTCDNPPCVNPNHLTIGTQADNIADAVRRGRVATGDRNGARKRPERVLRGEAQPMAKLNRRRVRLIRTLSSRGEPQARLAKHFGVSQATIWKVVSGKTWVAEKHAAG